MKLSVKTNLAPLKAEAIGLVNRKVESFRLQYLTPGAAQSMVYAEKAKELTRYYAQVAAGETPNEDDYPYLMIDAGLYNMSLANAADYVSFFQSEWERLGPPSEQVRRAAIVAIEAAKSPAEIEAASVLPLSVLLRR